jgi:diguanylate cyclase (GGDEF)-like protein/PAS domain S-box-containing protein
MVAAAARASSLLDAPMPEPSSPTPRFPSTIPVPPSWDRVRRVPRAPRRWRGWHGAMVGLATSAVLVAAAGWIATRDLARIDAANAWVRHTSEALGIAAAAATAVDRAETAQRGYLLVGDPAYLDAGLNADKAAESALAALRRRTADNASQQRRLDTLQRIVPQRLGGLARTVALAQWGARDSALAIVRTRAGKAESDTIREVLSRFVAEEQRLLRARMAAREERSRIAMRHTLLALGLAVASVAWTVLLLRRMLRRQAARRESLRAALATSEASEARYRALFTALPRPAWVYDVETLRFLAVNPAATAQYGWSEAEFLTLRITDVRPPEDAPRVAESARAAGAASVTAGQWRHRWRDGSDRDVLVSTHPLEYAGRAARLAIVDDVTERLAAERALRSRDARFRAAMTGMRDAFLVLRAVRADGAVRDFDILEMNAAGARLLGAPTVDAASRRTLLALLPDAAARGFLAIGRDVIAGGQPFEGERQTRGARVPAAEWVRLQAFPLEGEADTLVVIVRDITARKRAEARLREEAQRDALTGLLNRRGLEDAVDRRLQEAAAGGHPDILLYLDLDGFKGINDTFGHGEGDDALRVVASVLRRAMRAGDAIARLGGDEFVVYAPAGPLGVERDVDLLTQRVQHALGAERARGDAAGRRYELRTSIGGTVVRAGDTLASVLARADAALYEEKSRRRGARRAS